ncbi:expressed unknown protein [Seminavis robusta]|uniref:Uncharacterized protein n=1 Tax=Seminavis robusta TaxID=568900 RepID=A0A9N8HBS3_9STRA|nr:expressed unknown protein [Seminavis robusta]|eukprot:Sro194_g082680.1 n/a (963) ;mRNA; r:7050-9938
MATASLARGSEGGGSLSQRASIAKEKGQRAMMLSTKVRSLRNLMASNPYQLGSNHTSTFAEEEAAVDIDDSINDIDDTTVDLDDNDEFALPDDEPKPNKNHSEGRRLRSPGSPASVISGHDTVFRSMEEGPKVTESPTSSSSTKSKPTCRRKSSKTGSAGRKKAGSNSGKRHSHPTAEELGYEQEDDAVGAKKRSSHPTVEDLGYEDVDAKEPRRCSTGTGARKSSHRQPPSPEELGYENTNAVGPVRRRKSNGVKTSRQQRRRSKSAASSDVESSDLEMDDQGPRRERRAGRKPTNARPAARRTLSRRCSTGSSDEDWTPAQSGRRRAANRRMSTGVSPKDGSLYAAHSEDERLGSEPGKEGARNSGGKTDETGKPSRRDARRNSLLSRASSVGVGLGSSSNGASNSGKTDGKPSRRDSRRNSLLSRASSVGHGLGANNNKTHDEGKSDEVGKPSRRDARRNSLLSRASSEGHGLGGSKEAVNEGNSDETGKPSRRDGRRNSLSRASSVGHGLGGSKKGCNGVTSEEEDKGHSHGRNLKTRRTASERALDETDSQEKASTNPSSSGKGLKSSRNERKHAAHRNRSRFVNQKSCKLAPINRRSKSLRNLMGESSSTSSILKIDGHCSGSGSISSVTMSTGVASKDDYSISSKGPESFQRAKLSSCPSKESTGPERRASALSRWQSDPQSSPNASTEGIPSGQEVSNMCAKRVPPLAQGTANNLRVGAPHPVAPRRQLSAMSGHMSRNSIGSKHSSDLQSLSEADKNFESSIRSSQSRIYPEILIPSTPCRSSGGVSDGMVSLLSTPGSHASSRPNSLQSKLQMLNGDMTPLTSKPKMGGQGFVEPSTPAVSIGVSELGTPSVTAGGYVSELTFGSSGMTGNSSLLSSQSQRSPLDTWMTNVKRVTLHEGEYNRDATPRIVRRHSLDSVSYVEEQPRSNGLSKDSDNAPKAPSRQKSVASILF